jgi:hypothetical protein
VVLLQQPVDLHPAQVLNGAKFNGDRQDDAAVKLKAMR